MGAVVPQSCVQVHFTDANGVATFVDFRTLRTGLGTYALNWTGNVTGSLALPVIVTDAVWLRAVVTISTATNDMTFYLFDEAGPFSSVTLTRGYSHVSFASLSVGILAGSTPIDELAYYHEINPVQIGICAWQSCALTVPAAVPTANILVYMPMEDNLVYSFDVPGGGYGLLGSSQLVSLPTVALPKVVRPGTTFRHANLRSAGNMGTVTFAHASVPSGTVMHLEMLVFVKTPFGIGTFVPALVMNQFGTPQAPGTSPVTTTFEFRRTDSGSGDGFDVFVTAPGDTRQVNVNGAGPVNANFTVRIAYTRVLGTNNGNPTTRVYGSAGNQAVGSMNPNNWLTSTSSVSFSLPSSDIVIDELVYSFGTSPIMNGVCAFTNP